MFFKAGFIVFLYTLLVACASSSLYWNPYNYTVLSGDTLYSIAWRYEIDPEDLAKWNQLAPPYTIHPGDRLRTRASDSRSAADAGAAAEPQSPAPAEVEVRRGDTLYSLARDNNLSVERLAAINGLKKPYVINPGQVLRLSGEPVAVSTAARNTVTARPNQPVSNPVNSGAEATDVSPADTNRSVSWRWPVDGELVGRFNTSKAEAKGIDIAGSEGKPVRAASAGKVVYSGNGLISYGNLVIIKHSQSFLSAYAHNKTLLVKEGESVEAGQKIAELGKTGTEKPKLHFQIRKNGKPVDPLKYLPRS